MSEHENKFDPASVNPTSRPENGESASGEGEYSYTGEFANDHIYSDAHYTPAGENCVPPKYYTPRERSEKPPRPPKQHNSAAVKLVAVALVCALLGGFVGAGVMSHSLSTRLSALESSTREEEPLLATPAPAASSASVKSEGGSMSASEIYDQALQQTVGINSEITYTNFFGLNSSAAVSGSGFVVSEDGYILTNYHVIEKAYQNHSDINVMFHDGSSYVADVVGYEKYNDIAVLKIDATGLDPVSFADSDGIAVGDVVYPVGNPLGELDFSMSTGHVSALNRLITTDESGVAINMFQMDAAVNSGNSGGPVYNANGQVIGVVTAKYSATGVEGIGFAIPINDAVKIANDLIENGYVTGKAAMGVSIDQRYNSIYAQYYNMPLGAYVYSVESGSCAEKAGLQSGDIITALGDSTVTGYTDLTAALHNFSAGDSAELSVYRSGETLTLTITFDEAKN